MWINLVTMKLSVRKHSDLSEKHWNAFSYIVSHTLILSITILPFWYLSCSFLVWDILRSWWVWSKWQKTWQEAKANAEEKPFWDIIVSITKFRPFTKCVGGHFGNDCSINEIWRRIVALTSGMWALIESLLTCCYPWLLLYFNTCPVS